MDITNKKVGIWGFGLVGKSALNYLTKMNNTCQILDNRPLTPDELNLINHSGGTFVSQNKIDQLMRNNDYIIASPGIDITPYYNKEQFICELDIFGHQWKKPIIAITGTVGKTTITTILGNILSKKYKVAIGGNIGTPMLDLLERQNEVDFVILELSSWQLEYAQHFRPFIAIISNIFPNHLDRHKTMHHYVKAKLHILRNQTQKDVAILPISLKATLGNFNTKAKKKWIENQTTNFSNDIKLPEETFRQNWQIILATLDTLELPYKLIEGINPSIEHRLEYVGTFNQVTYYNDSKSTTPASTSAAINKFKNKNIILILGGLSKGIDRSSLIRQLPPNIKHVICFGKESKKLKMLCSQQKSASAFDNLEQALLFCQELSNSNDIVLFSPSGASFDLYKNYKKRGEHFKQVIASF